MIGRDVDPETIAAALADKADTLRQELEDKIKANLSGAILQSRSAALLGSISSDLQSDGSSLTATVESADVLSNMAARPARMTSCRARPGHWLSSPAARAALPVSFIIRARRSALSPLWVARSTICGTRSAPD
jgi:hypothetical protein